MFHQMLGFNEGRKKAGKRDCVNYRRQTEPALDPQTPRSPETRGQRSSVSIVSTTEVYQAVAIIVARACLVTRRSRSRRSNMPCLGPRGSHPPSSASALHNGEFHCPHSNAWIIPAKEVTRCTGAAAWTLYTVRNSLFVSFGGIRYEYRGPHCTCRGICNPVLI
jgi:hypothetical protein